MLVQRLLYLNKVLTIIFIYCARNTVKAKNLMLINTCHNLFYIYHTVTWALLDCCVFIRQPFYSTWFKNMELIQHLCKTYIQ